MYFNLHARGEVLRMALWKSKMPFEDQRIELSEWPAIKPTTPSGSMPVLTTPDGTKLTQTNSILRFIGAKGGLYSKKVEEMMAIDQLVDWGPDIHITMGGIAGSAAFGGPVFTPEENLAKCAPLFDQWFRIVEARLKGHGKKYVAGTDHMTIADLMLAQVPFTLIENDMHFDPGCQAYARDLMAKNPCTKKWCEMMMMEFKDYLATRKPSPF